MDMKTGGCSGDGVLKRDGCDCAMWGCTVGPGVTCTVRGLRIGVAPRLHGVATGKSGAEGTNEGIMAAAVAVALFAVVVV